MAGQTGLYLLAHTSISYRRFFVGLYPACFIIHLLQDSEIVTFEIIYPIKDISCFAGIQAGYFLTHKDCCYETTSIVD